MYTLVLLADAYLRENGGINFSKYYNEDIFHSIFHFRKFSLNFKQFFTLYNYLNAPKLHDSKAKIKMHSIQLILDINNKSLQEQKII